MAQTPFFWGRAGAKLTPDQVIREREAANLLAKGAMDFSPVQHWSQGLGRVAQGLLAGLDYRAADRGEADIADRNKTLIASLLGGGSAAGAAPASSAIPMTSAAGEMAATSPAQPIDMTGNEVYNEFIGAAREGGLTNPFGLAALAATGKAESGFDPSNVNRTWSDPSESGQPGTAGGILSWRGPRYDALAATGDLSPRGQGNFFIQENPQLIAALNNAKSIEEAQSLINNAWQFAGFDRPGGEAARRLQLAREFLPSFQGAGEVAAATPEAAIEAVSPLQPAPEAAMSFAGQERAPPVSLSDEVAAYQQTPEYAAVFPGRAQPAQAAAAAPVQVAGGGDRVPMASQSINPAIIEALTDPQASPQTQRIAGILLEQQQRQAQAAEEQRLLAADPMRRIELESAQIKLDQLRNPLPDVTDTVKSLRLRAQEAGLQPGTPEYQNFFITQGVRAPSNIAPPPVGYRYEFDNSGNPVSLSPIPGSQAAVEAAQREKALGKQEGQRATATDVVVNAGVRALNAKAGEDGVLPTTGLLGRAASFIPESNAAEMRRQVGVLKANASASTIQAMRESSPTGAALGGVSDKDIELLANKAGALDPESPYFERDLKDYVKTQLEVIHGPEEGKRLFGDIRWNDDRDPNEIRTDIPGVKIRRKN